jgi:hypothetical protein
LVVDLAGVVVVVVMLAGTPVWVGVGVRLAALADATQDLDDDGLGGGAERLYRLLMTRLGQVAPVHLNTHTQNIS